MTSPLLNKYTLPAERIRGCVFADLYESSSTISTNGGITSGSPTITLAEGISLNGSTQSVSYPDRGYSFGNGSTDDSFSITAKVYMTDATNFTIAAKGGASSDYEWRLFTDGSDRITITLYDNSSSGYIGRYYSTALTSYENKWIDLAFTYSASKTSAGCKIYLNGAQVDNTNNQSGSYGGMEPLGASVLVGLLPGGNYSAGKIKSLKIWKCELTSQEVSDISSNKTFLYERKALINLPMGIAQHDPTSVRTLDMSGKGNHGTFGDGSTSTTYPTKLVDKHGYYFDGGDSIKFNNYASIYASTALTFCMTANLTDTTTKYIVGWLNGGGGGAGYGIAVNVTGTGKIEAYTCGAGWMSTVNIIRPGHIFTYVYTQNGTSWKCYLNGKLDNSGTSLTSIIPDYGAKYLMRRQDVATYAFGTMYDFKFYDFVISPIQAADYHLQMMKTINTV